MDKTDEHYDFSVKVLRASREDAGITREELGARMNVSTKTIANWENAVSCPDVTQAHAWFVALHRNPIPYLMLWLFPEGYHCSEENSAADDLAILDAIHLLRPEDKERLLWVLMGNHGSYFPCVLQMLVAHLHLSMKYKYSICTQVMSQYKLCKDTDELAVQSHVAPDLNLMGRCVNAVSDAAHHGVNCYIPNDSEQIGD